jgi:hypothetical protein
MALKNKRLNSNDGSFQALGAVCNLSFGKLGKCMNNLEIGIRRTASLGESFD